MRLFIGITLSKRMTSSLLATMSRLKETGVSGRYVPKENLHLTLAFLGELDGPEGAMRAMESICFQPFSLSLSPALGRFDALLWAGIESSRELKQLVHDLRASLDHFNVPYDRKDFLPHITIVRKAAGSWEGVAAAKGSMVVKKISLMKSEPGDGKQVYTEIFSRDANSD